MNYEGTNVSVL